MDLYLHGVETGVMAALAGWLTYLLWRRRAVSAVTVYQWHCDCGRVTSWRGGWTDCPPCPHCGERPAASLLAEMEREGV